MTTEAEYINNMLQGLIPQLNDPASPYFLPHTIQTKTQFDPQNSPYTGFAAGSWSLGAIPGTPGMQSAVNICTALQPFGDIYIPPPPPNNTPNVNLTNIRLENLSQASIVSLSAAGPDSAVVITGTISWGQLSAHGFSGVRIIADFSLTQPCCNSSDGRTCNAAPSNNVGTGTLTMSITQATATAVMPITVLEPNNLTLGVSTVDFSAPLTAMTVTAVIDNIPHQQQWDTQANQALSQPATLQMFLAKIQAQLDTRKSDIAQAMTQNIDYYLQSTHQYPYDGGGFGALF